MKRLSHFSSASLDPCTGMGRVAVHWREALIRRGWIFQQFGLDEVPMPPIKPRWAYSARRAWRRTSRRDHLMLAHEPSAEIIRQTGIPTVLFSHGIEERGALLCPQEPRQPSSSLRHYSMRFFWHQRSIQRRKALSRCPLLLLSSEEDSDYVISYFERSPEDIFVFRNGVDPSQVTHIHQPADESTILFYGSWLARKGKTTLVEAAIKLAEQGVYPRWLLVVGDGISEQEVLSDWPLALRDQVLVKQKIAADEEDSIFAMASIYVLPSYFEGQPLALLQAMESGRCVISTRCCGQRDIVKHGINGFLFEPGSSEQFAHLIATTLGNREMRCKVGIQAKLDMASRRWSVVADEVAQRLDQFLDQQTRFHHP